MKLIPLTRGLFTKVDDEDFEKLAVHRWHASRHRGKNHYRPKGYINGKGTYLYRFLLGAKRGQYVDHINGDPLDNRKSNLRFCTPSENNRNVGKRNTNSSGFKGVSHSDLSPARPWRAQIQTGKKFHFLGHFSTPEEAARAYDVKAKEMFGEFAKLNFPEAKGA